MDRFTKDKLNLTERSDDQLHTVLSGFELKWRQKARRAQSEDRVTKF